MTQMPPAYPPLPSGNDPAVLPNLPRWNWGACLLTPYWAWAHGMHLFAFIAFFVGPVSVIILPLIMGFLGSGLAWKYRSFASYEEFQRVQSAWARAGVALIIAAIVIELAVFMRGR